MKVLIIRFIFRRIRFNTLSTLVLLLGLMSCSSNINNNSTEINVFENCLESIKTSQFVNSQCFIPLETKDECLIGSVSKLIETDDKIYILDSKSAKSLFVFNKEGKFLYKIGNSGKGPGEYLRPVDFSIDIKNNFIIIIDFDRKILKMDLKGNLITEKMMPRENKSITNIEIFNGLIYAYTGQRMNNVKKFQILQLDSKLNPIERQFKYEYSFQASNSFLNALYTFNDTINFLSLFNYSLYNKHGDLFEERYHFNMAGKELSLKGVTLEQYLTNKDNAYFFQSIVEGDEVIYLPIFDKGVPKYGFLHKKNRKFLLIREILEDPIVFIPPISYYKDKFIATLRSDLFLKRFPDNIIKPKITDNPIIIKYQMHFIDEK